VSPGKLSDLIARAAVPLPWSEGEKIPWNEPGFSRRMLDEHLNQDHDAASRRVAIIDTQVSWIHEKLLERRSSRILDLGCGPGLYATRLAANGHSLVGVDFSPASIEYAKTQSRGSAHDIRFMLGDIRHAPLPGPFGLAMLLFGEANAFRRDDLEEILIRTRRALSAGGLLLVEPHPFPAVRRIGTRPPSWHTARRGLFGSDPYLCLRESFWEEERAAATERWHIVDLATGDTTLHAASTQAYTEAEYATLFARCGFHDIDFLPGVGDAIQEDLFAIVARAT
jgi:SAM-dependent methyltransferase